MVTIYFRIFLSLEVNKKKKPTSLLLTQKAEARHCVPYRNDSILDYTSALILELPSEVRLSEMNQQSPEQPKLRIQQCKGINRVH